MLHKSISPLLRSDPLQRKNPNEAQQAFSFQRSISTRSNQANADSERATDEDGYRLTGESSQVPSKQL